MQGSGAVSGVWGDASMARSEAGGGGKVGRRRRDGGQSRRGFGVARGRSPARDWGSSSPLRFARGFCHVPLRRTQPASIDGLLSRMCRQVAVRVPIVSINACIRCLRHGFRCCHVPAPRTVTTPRVLDHNYCGPAHPYPPSFFVEFLLFS